MWSSVVHGAIMAVQSLLYPEHRAHLYGDVLILFIVAAVLGALTPARRAQTVRAAAPSAA